MTTHRTSGLRALFDSARFYVAFQQMLGGGKAFYDSVIVPAADVQPGESVLDIGCGPGHLVESLPTSCPYVGFDLSPEYIERARARYTDRGVFMAQRVSEAVLEDLPPFDVIFAVALLHHLSNDEAARLADIAAFAARAGGRLVTYDPCYCEGQSRISRLLVSQDRGTMIRRPDEYAGIARRRFGTIDATVVSGHLRVPYHACVMRCTNARSPDE